MAVPFREGKMTTEMVQEARPSGDELSRQDVWRSRRELSGRGRPRHGGRESTQRRDKVDLRNTWQVVAGSVLVPLGVVLILIAWYGSAHTAFVQQQIPYLVSGSFAGLGCMVLGGLLYWAHWLYRIFDQSDQQHEEQMRALRETLAAMGGRIAQGAGAVAPPDTSPAVSRTETGAQTACFLATSTGTMYHLPGCPVLAQHGEGVRVVAPESVPQMQACGICLARRDAEG
jgi:hypothetical protein